jgi:hypothetical protein
MNTTELTEAKGAVHINTAGAPSKWFKARASSKPNFEAHEDQTGFWQDIKWEDMTKEEQNLYKQQYPVV